MRNSGWWTIACTALLAASHTACARHDASPEFAAIEKAHRAGVLTEAEYTARKAAIQARAVRLSALDRALDAGLLTPDEYRLRKAALLSADTPPPVPVPASAAVSAAAPIPAAPNAPQGHSYRMKLARIVDAQGFAQPMTSASLLIPVEWQAQGATTWNIRDQCNSIQTHFLAAGPDGRAFEQFPAATWVWADDPKPLRMAAAQKARMGARACDVMPPMSAQDYLARNLARLRPNAQLVGYEPAPKLLDALRQQAHQAEQAARGYNLQQQVKVDALRARVRYSLDGQPVEEWILASTVATGTVFGGRWSYRSTANAAGLRAPQGQLDASAPLFELIASTWRVDPQWQAKVTENALKLQQIELKGIRDRAAIVAKSAEDTRNTQREIFENRQQTQDRAGTQFSQYLRGVETYRNPATGETFDLDSNYGHAWANDRGEYLLTDQAGFDPNSVSGNTQTWTQLQQVKK